MSTSDVREFVTMPVMQRLRLIDFLLDHYGMVNRSAIMDYFGVSTPQASMDIREYLKLAPDNMTYDRTTRVYRRNVGFTRVIP